MHKDFIEKRELMKLGIKEWANIANMDFQLKKDMLADEQKTDAFKRSKSMTFSTQCSTP